MSRRKRSQLALELAYSGPATLSSEIERDLVAALAELLLQVASAQSAGVLTEESGDDCKADV
jgi:hypothetical protein